MAGKQEAEPLSFKTPEMMMSGDKRNAASSENRILHISRGTTRVVFFFYRSPRPIYGLIDPD
ncbi:integrase [Citrobacter sp. S2-9]|uniref:Integrase n=1 Tax=Citrobacter enshiensis TaxID=2971264 RepID=A0ABT8PW04_9ENTR|nr:integrase [Citrobacter enshiensis]MDN8600550.1 integrase [Citrobacter enshiensis]